MKTNKTDGELWKDCFVGIAIQAFIVVLIVASL